MGKAKPKPGKRPRQPAKEAVATRIYSFGAVVSDDQLPQALDQLYVGHCFSKELKWIELGRRDQSNTIVEECNRQLQVWSAEILELQGKLEKIRSEISRRNSSVRRTTRATPQEKLLLDEIKAKIKATRVLYKAFKKTAYQSPSVRDRLKIVDAWVKKCKAEARQRPGLYWGSYSAIERSLTLIGKGPPPTLSNFIEEGRVAVRLEEQPTWDELCAGQNKKLLITPLPPEGLDEKAARRFRRTEVQLRIGTTEDRKPIYLKALVWWHRLLPKKSLILWAWLLRRRVGTHFRWHLQLTVRLPEVPGASRHAKDGTVGVDIGWRRLPEQEQGLRVANWAGSDGARGQLLIPEDELAYWRHPRGLHGVIDNNFNLAKLELELRLKKFGTLPEWLVWASKSLSKWKSPNRLAALAWLWNERRFAGDVEMFEPLWAWRKQDRHLFEWVSNEERNFVNWRKKFYEKFACDLSQKYRRVIVARINYAEMQKTPPSEHLTEEQQAIVYNRKAAAAGGLSARVCDTVSTYNLAPVDVLSICQTCGQQSGNGRSMALILTCQNCQTVYDRDQNAALSLLAWGLANSELPPQSRRTVEEPSA